MKSVLPFCTGFLVAVCLILLTGAIREERKEVGRYQIIAAAEDNYTSVYVVDTATGVVKMVSQENAEDRDDPQLGKTFEEMRPIFDD